MRTAPRCLALLICAFTIAGAAGTDTADAAAPPAADQTAAAPDTAATASAPDTVVPEDAPWLAESEDTAVVSPESAVTPAVSRRAAGLRDAAARFGYAVRASRPGRWIRRNGVRLLLIALSVAVIWFAFSYFGAKREQERFLTTTRLSIMDKEVQRACRLVEDGYADPGLTPQSLCAQLVTGESFLESLYQRELGMSVAEFIEQVRVNRAKQLLRANALAPVSELAAATGFGSADDLARTFERVAQVSVERYREALRAGEEPSA